MGRRNFKQKEELVQRPWGRKEAGILKQWASGKSGTNEVGEERESSIMQIIKIPGERI